HCRIFLREIRLRCKIGIDAAERETPQRVLADMEIAPAAAAAPDRPAVDYAAVLRRLREFAASKQHGLLEHFAEEIADIVLTEFAAAEVRVFCRKPEPFSDLGAAGAEVWKTRDSPPEC
ncbi:MAG: dihydroneopterin aldolase, partial [Gammaproteobacteria bacterium]